MRSRSVRARLAPVRLHATVEVAADVQHAHTGEADELRLARRRRWRAVGAGTWYGFRAQHHRRDVAGDAAELEAIESIGGVGCAVDADRRAVQHVDRVREIGA